MAKKRNLVTPSAASIGKTVLYTTAAGKSVRADIDDFYPDGTVALTIYRPMRYLDHVAQDPTGKTPGTWRWIGRD